MPGELTAPLVEVEQRRAPRFRNPKIVEEARQRGFAAVEGTLVPGVSAVSISGVRPQQQDCRRYRRTQGQSEEIDIAAEGKVTKALLRGAAEIWWRAWAGWPQGTENAGARPDTAQHCHHTHDHLRPLLAAATSDSIAGRRPECQEYGNNRKRKEHAMQIDLPEVVAEVTAAFNRYEKALGDQRRRGARRHLPRRIRAPSATAARKSSTASTGEIAAFRAARAPTGLNRSHLQDRHHHLRPRLRRGSTLFHRRAHAGQGRTSQKCRAGCGFPDGWHVVAAHVRRVIDGEGCCGRSRRFSRNIPTRGTHASLL